MVDKLYLVVRSDLPPGLQAAQLVHAMRQWVEEHPEADREWFQKSNTVALLAATNEAQLGVIVEAAQSRRIPVACFYEPDQNNELTAIAIGPAGKRLTRNLPLALQWLSVSSSQPRSSSVSPRSSS